MSKVVVVALTGDTIQIDLTVYQLINESGGSVVCFTPRNDAIETMIIPNNAQTKSSTLKNFFLHNVTPSFSGEYRCEIQGVTAYWSLMVRGELWCLCTSISIHSWLLFLLCNIELLVQNDIPKQI